MKLNTPIDSQDAGNFNHVFELAKGTLEIFQEGGKISKKYINKESICNGVSAEAIIEIEKNSTDMREILNAAKTWDETSYLRYMQCLLMLVSHNGKESALTTIKTPAPAIGTLWTEQGGIYAGIVRGTDDASDYHLILLPDTTGELNWNDAIAWAKGLDAELPTRREQAILFGNLSNEFELGWHWSKEQNATTTDYAWIQDFYDGGQGYDRQSNEYRARAVRRLSIIQ